MKDDNRQNDLKIMIINESVSQSFVTDFVSFGGLILTLYFNYAYLGNSVLIKIFVLFCFFVIVFKRGSKRVKKMTPDEALRYLQDKQKKGE